MEPTHSSKDLDGFWNELIKKSEWGTTNAKKEGQDFRNLEILESRPTRQSDSHGLAIERQSTAGGNKKTFTILSSILLILLVLSGFLGYKFFTLRNKDKSCNGGVWSFTESKCVWTANYCNEHFAQGSIFNNGDCRCPDGFGKDGNACKKTADCSQFANVYMGADNTCQCSDGYVMNGEKCISYYEDCRLQNGSFNGQTDSKGKPICQCKQGSFWDVLQKTCVSCSKTLDKSADIKNQCGLSSQTTSSTTAVKSTSTNLLNSIIK